MSFIYSSTAETPQIDFLLKKKNVLNNKKKKNNVQ